MKGLLLSHPDVPIASIDSATLLVLNLEEKISEYKAGTHRFVVFKKVSGGLNAGGEDEDGKKSIAEGRLITSMLDLKEGESLSFNNMSNLINTVEKGGGGSNSKMVKLTSMPQVKTRTKKLEAAERKKRERIENKKSGSTATKTTPGGMFTENDGSKEGRKVERDRRREENKKKNPNYKEISPEQKAEVERRRRERMAEEEAKWNISPDDAPDEGDLVDEEEGGYAFGDEEDGEIDLDGDEEDVNVGEDVMDLD